MYIAINLSVLPSASQPHSLHCEFSNTFSSWVGLGIRLGASNTYTHTQPDVKFKIQTIDSMACVN